MHRYVFAAFCAGTFFTAPALAAELVDARDPSRIVNIARGFGSADLEKDTDGNPKISGRIDGNRYWIFFYGCSNTINCKSIRFRTAWIGNNQYNLQHMNAWNNKWRYVRAFLDSQNDPTITLDVDLDHGVSKANLENEFSRWQLGLRNFRKEVLDND